MYFKRYAPFVAVAASLMLVGAGCFGSTAVKTTPKPAPAPAPAPAPEPTPDTGTPGGPSGAMRVRGNVLIVSDQKPRATLSVFIANDKPAFIVVSESAAAGGKILAVSPLIEESAGYQTLTLSRTTKNGETLTLAAYVDDGNGKYGPEDKALLNYNGDPVTSTATIDAKATEGPNPAL